MTIRFICSSKDAQGQDLLSYSRAELQSRSRSTRQVQLYFLARHLQENLKMDLTRFFFSSLPLRYVLEKFKMNLKKLNKYIPNERVRCRNRKKKKKKKQDDTKQYVCIVEFVTSLLPGPTSYSRMDKTRCFLFPHFFPLVTLIFPHIFFNIMSSLFRISVLRVGNCNIQHFPTIS